MPGNTGYWTGHQVTDYERRQRLLVPRKDEMLDTIVALMPFGTQDVFTVLDVGAGQGATSARVLERYPRAHVVLFDASAEMLAVAEERLARSRSRIAVLQGDFDDEGWQTPIPRPAHAVVSTVALHYLDPARRAPFFREVYDLLAPGGYFAHGGSFDSEQAAVQAYWDRTRLEHTQRQLRELEGRDVPIERLRENWQRESQKAGIHRLRLNEQRCLLAKAGFAHVETVWRYLSCAVVAAYKEAP
jgi:tRNA (cmo5U34)-methyltransferase